MKKLMTAKQIESKLCRLFDHGEIDDWVIEELMSIVNTIKIMSDTFHTPLKGFSLTDTYDIEVIFDNEKTGLIIINEDELPELKLAI